jgi:hypothetical protein
MMQLDPTLWKRTTCTSLHFALVSLIISPGRSIFGPHSNLPPGLDNMLDGSNLHGFATLQHMQQQQKLYILPNLCSKSYAGIVWMTGLLPLSTIQPRYVIILAVRTISP